MVDYQYFEHFELDSDEPVFTTGVVTRLISIPLWLLKQLDYEGIISPKRDVGKSRLYSKKDLDKIHHVWYLMEKRKVTINGIKVILEMESELRKEE